MKKRLRRLIEGLTIIEAYSNNVSVEDHQIVAGPSVKAKISEEDRTKLENLDWFFEENDGWTLYLG